MSTAREIRARHALPLQRLSVADELAGVLRQRILDGELPAGTPLRELELAAVYAVSRHTLRTALRVLETEGIVRIEPNRGASVASLDAEELAALFELRAALELEAALLALARNEGKLPSSVHDALGHLVAICRRARPSWRAVTDGHAALHGAIVAASASPRIEAAYATLAAELRLFLVQLHPVWSLERMVSHHEELVTGLERDGPVALRRHLADGIDAVLARPRSDE